MNSLTFDEVSKKEENKREFKWCDGMRMECGWNTNGVRAVSVINPTKLVWLLSVNQKVFLLGKLQ